jgi:TRAP-type C4-dicarboxylate transport system substrate-binding protein
MNYTPAFTAAVLLAAAASATPAAAETRLVVNCFWPPQHFTCSEILPQWLEDVEAATEGRVTGNIPPRSVAPPPEQLASVEKGIVDVAVQFNGLIGNRINGPLVAMNPFVGSYDAPAMTQALWETNQQFFPDEFDTVHLLTQWVITPGELFSMTDEPLNSLDDFAARKIWALPGPLANIAAELGAGVVSTPAVESNEVISRGVVDAHLGLSGDALMAFQVLPYTKSRTKFSRAVYSTSFSMVINSDKWAEISPEDQEAITNLSGVTLGRTLAAKWDSVAESVYARFPEEGIPIIDADPAFEQALVDAAAPITAAWVAKATEAGIDGQGALDFYKARLQELSQ